jgi:hypothetical protein
MGRFLINWDNRNNYSTRHLFTADDTREVQQKCRFGIRKPLFCPLNYGNSDICDFRFSTADCKQRTSVVCAEIASSYTDNYTAIQRLIQRQDAICREPFERASATAFT